MLVAGTSGAGKPRCIVAPNFLQATGSYVVSDPKGNLYRKYGPYLESKGYKVRCLDFVHPEKSVHYNCLKYIHNSQDIVKMANMIVHQRKIASLQDPFWEESATILLSGLIGYLWENKNLADNEKNLQSVLKLLRAGRRGGDSSTEKTPLERIMEEFGRSQRGSWAYEQFQNANVVVSDTERSMDTLANLFFTQAMNEPESFL